MDKQILKIKLKHQAKQIAWRAITTVILTLTAIITVWAYAAFTEPSVGPNSSDQDFAQNILGNNDANNDFTSSSVASNADGSIIEREEYIQATLGIKTDATTTPSAASSVFAALKGLDKPQWAGATASTYTGNLGGTKGANVKCNADYPGSHACTWDEIIKFGTVWDWNINVWIVDGAYYNDAKQRTKDGFMSGTNTPEEFNCFGWTNADTVHDGPTLTGSNIALRLFRCDSLIKIPCCK
jgi:hypothetical protein